MRSPQRKRGAGAAWRLACALLITVHAAAAHERPAAAIANALVVANEQRASIDVPSATKSDAGSSSAGLQSAALLYRGATNLAPVVGSALLLASAVPARSSAWRAPVFGYLLFPGALSALRRCEALLATTPSTIFRAWRPGWCRKNGASSRATS